MSKNKKNGMAALVSGCSRGIGRAICLRLERDGYHVIANDLPRQQEALESLAAEIADAGGRFDWVTGDVSDEAEVAATVARAAEMAGRLDLLVNNAGILTANRVDDISHDEWDKTFAVNAKGTFLMSRAVLPHMRALRRGRIVNIASIGGKRGAPGEAHYCASKAAVIEFTRVLAMETAKQGITVNCVCPGVIDTKMGRHNFPDDVSRRKMHEITAMGRIGQPEDVVGTVSFFASDDAAFITGQSLNVCGGIQFD